MCPPRLPAEPLRTCGFHPRFRLETGAGARTSFGGPGPLLRGVPGLWDALAAPPGPLYPARPPHTPTCRPAHLTEVDPGWLPAERLQGPRRALPRPPEEVSVGHVKEGHSQVAAHLRQRLQHTLGDRGTALKGPQGHEPPSKC